MASHSLLVLVFAVSCFTLSSCNHGVGDTDSVPVTYPVRVLNTAQEECLSDDQREPVRAEVGHDLRSILQSYLGETSVVRVVHCYYRTLLCSPLQELYVRTSPALMMGRWFRHLMAMFLALWQTTPAMLATHYSGM